MTGIANRKSFEERFAHEIAQKAARRARPMAMLLWDIDSFKFINDSYGHRAGDRVLQSVAACFMAAVRGSDFVARIGGEEFVMLLSGAKIAQAMPSPIKCARRWRRCASIFEERRFASRCRAGVTELKEHDVAEAAFDRADAALYRAKHGGKNLLRGAR